MYFGAACPCSDRYICTCRSSASALAGDLPRSLPAYLVFHCGNPEHWVYADQRCNGMNDCGDCSDEMGSCKSAFGLCLVKDLLIAWRGFVGLVLTGAPGKVWRLVFSETQNRDKTRGLLHICGQRLEAVERGETPCFKRLFQSKWHYDSVAVMLKAHGVVVGLIRLTWLGNL